MKRFLRTTAAARVSAVLALAAMAFTGTVSLDAHAADSKGNYIVRGIGARPCSDYMAAVGKSATDVMPYMSWMEGYLTGINRLQAQTFDVSPVTEAAIVGQMVRNYCTTQPTLRFETAVAQLMNFFAPYKVTAQSQLVEVTVGDARAALRQSTLKWMQEKLKAQGQFTGTPDGLYGNTTKTALIAFQKAAKIPETGVPDARTLVQFIQNEAQAQGAKP
ncbi:peptidoglycan-binding domain-containing protein [Emcibacter sp. SYSU 3D8]|uniref:peptidoglycan-binding domain-containing protein n=1 Tax=Emcibacter sp. SYSU 3D8 TaxID=3133969 RepID=UPI0031FEE1C6